MIEDQYTLIEQSSHLSFHNNTIKFYTNLIHEHI